MLSLLLKMIYNLRKKAGAWPPINVLSSAKRWMHIPLRNYMHCEVFYSCGYCLFFTHQATFIYPVSKNRKLGKVLSSNIKLFGYICLQNFHCLYESGHFFQKMPNKWPKQHFTLKPIISYKMVPDYVFVASRYGKMLLFLFLGACLLCWYTHNCVHNCLV